MLQAMAAGANILGGLSKGIGARERARAMYQQAGELDINAEIEQLNAQTTANDLRANLMKTLASNNVALAASGVAGGGSVEAMLSADTEDFGRQERNVTLDAMLKSGSMRRQARSLRKSGKRAMIAGYLDAASSMMGGVGGGGGGVEGLAQAQADWSAATGN